MRTRGLLRVANSDRVALYYRERLSRIFAGVAEPARTPYNSRNTPLFTLCFAVANEKGKSVALRIAKHILEHA